MNKQNRQAITKSDLIIESWKRLNAETLGRRELEEIQLALRTTFGDGGVESPASIARTLADLGVPLRHPDILEADTDWRAARMLDSSPLGALNFSTIDDAVSSARTINGEWTRLQSTNDANANARLKAIVTALRQELSLLGRSKAIEEDRKKVAVEVANWLGVWLQNPQIFADWVELRTNSREFLKTFKE